MSGLSLPGNDDGLEEVSEWIHGIISALGWLTGCESVAMAWMPESDAIDVQEALMQ